MVGGGVNLATTKDGGAYNKLQRPADYLTMTTTAQPTDAPTLDSPHPTSANKRKREHEDATLKQKRTRAGSDRAERESHRTGAGEKGKPRASEGGMRALLPGLDDDGGSSDEGSVGEALAYLRSVRSEALAIPDLLVARTTGNGDHNDNHDRVLFRDGTYIAVDEDDAASTSDQGSTEMSSFPGAQERQAQLLLKRFHALRATLRDIADNQNLAVTQEVSSLARSLTRKRKWSDLINKEFPKLDLVVQLDDAAIYQGLQSCVEHIAQATSISAQISCWIWTLLALVGDVGTLDNDRVDCIRDLGRKAGVLATRLRKGDCEPSLVVEENGARDESLRGCSEHDLEEGEACEQGEAHDAQVACDGHEREEVADEADTIETAPQVKSVTDPTSDAEMSISEDGDNSSQPDDQVSELERARARLLSQLSDRLVQGRVPPSIVPNTRKRAKRAQGPHIRKGRMPSTEESDDLVDYGVDLNTRSTIDMIWTIMAEHFGQRDFLEFRKRW